MLQGLFRPTYDPSRVVRLKPFTAERAMGCYRVDIVVYGVDHWPPSAWRSLDVARSTHVHVALNGERVVGFVAFAYGQGDCFDALHLVKLAVDPDYRHRGIGTSLLNDLIDGKILDPHTPYTRLIHSLPEPEASDRKTLDGCGWLASRGFRSYADREWWRFVFGPDELLGRWNAPETCP